jgi:hypothetical protein
MSWRHATIVSVVELGGMVTLAGNHVNVSQICSARVSQVHTVWQWYESRAGPPYHPSRECGDQVLRLSGFSWAKTRVLGGREGSG